MSASLEGPRLKLARAWKHLEDLELAVSVFIKTQGEKVTVEHESETGYRTWVIAEPDQPDVRWNLLIGDVLYNLRSALDYLAWQLVEANGRNPNTTGTGFPLFDDISLYVEKGLPMIQGMSPVVQAAIEAAQPYHRPSPEYRTDSLLLLNRLSNVYKHRHFKLTLLSVKGGGGYELPRDFEPWFGAVEGRTVLAAWKVSDPNMQVDYSPFFDVVFAETPWGDELVVESLQRLMSATTTLVSDLGKIGGLAA